MDTIAWIYCTCAVGMLLFVAYMFVFHWQYEEKKDIKIQECPTQTSDEPSWDSPGKSPDWAAAEAMIKTLDWPAFERKFKPGGAMYGYYGWTRLNAVLNEDAQLIKKIDDAEIFFGNMWEKYKDQKRISYIVAQKHKKIAKLRRLRARTTNPIKE